MSHGDFFVTPQPTKIAIIHSIFEMQGSSSEFSFLFKCFTNCIWKNHFLVPPSEGSLSKNFPYDIQKKSKSFNTIDKAIQEKQPISMIVTVWHTGCSIMIDQKFELHTQAKIQPRSWERCSFSFDVWIFWNCAFESSKKFHIVFKFWWNFDAQIFRICKIHRKLRSKQMSLLLSQ